MEIWKDEKNFLLLTFCISLFILSFFSSPIINSGDGGGLITAVYGLGIAHSPGYPLYCLLGKIFTFIPIGNIAERVAFFSALFGAISVTLVYYITYLKTKEKAASFFSAFFLLFSYSFFNQSLISKFYPLNLSIVLLIYIFAYTAIVNGYKNKYAFLISLLFALGMTNHHTVAFMVFPCIYLFILYRKLLYKKIPFLIFFGILLIFLIYIYIVIRSNKDNLYTFWTIKNFNNLWDIFWRKNYGSGSSLNLLSSVDKNFITKFLNSIMNSILLLKKEFFYFSFFLWIIGCLKLFKDSKKKFIFYLLSIISFSFFLSFFVFSSKPEKLTLLSYYIVGHQYFLPLFAFYCIGVGLGISFIIDWFQIRKFKLVLFVISLIPFFIFPFRIIDSNYNNDYTLYYTGIDDLFSMGIGGLYWIEGDNIINRTLYLKNIEHYRDDICAFANPMKADFGMRNLCPLKKYKIIHNNLNVVFDNKTISYLIKLPQDVPYYSNIDNLSFINRKGLFDVLAYRMFLREQIKKDKEKILNSLKLNRSIFYPYINEHKNWCFDIGNDDYFSKLVCSGYIRYFIMLAYDLNDNKNSRKSIIFNLKNKRIKIYVNNQNRKYLIIAYILNKFGNYGFYLYDKNNKFLNYSLDNKTKK